MPAATAPATPDAIVIVDPDPTTGLLLVKEVQKRGLIPIILRSASSSGVSALLDTDASSAWVECFQQMNDDIAATAEACQVAANGSVADDNAATTRSTEIIGCLAGGETGVELAHALQQLWGSHVAKTAPSSSSKPTPSYRTLREATGKALSDFDAFLGDSDVYPIIVKAPEVDAGTVPAMYVCKDRSQAEQRIQESLKAAAVGRIGAGQQQQQSESVVLVQECVQGTEYLVDHVSRDGVHKTVVVYEYEYRLANGSKRVPIGCRPVTNDVAIAFVRQVLDENYISNGPSFAHIILPDTAQSPCLVSLHLRAHGGRWRPLCKAITGGYSQVELTIDACVDAEAFARVPDRPTTLKATGQEVRLISFAKGTVRATPGFDVIQKLPSFVSIETNVSAGSEITYTTDASTSVGSVLLLHRDHAVVERDIEFIRYMQDFNGLLLLETKMENLRRPLDEHKSHQRVFSADGPSLIRHMSLDHPTMRKGLVKRVTTVDASKEAVLIVDPYSTGCLIADEVQKRGYSILALWTKGFAPAMKTHIPLSVIGSLKYDAEIDQQDSLAATAAAVAKAAGTKRVVSCFAGGEAGVDYADALSEHMGLRTNGTRIPNKRDKKIQQELIKDAGLRSVRQSCGTEFSEVKEFLETEPFPVVLKPVESAGSDGVKLCHSMKEAQEHFEVLMKSQMVNGGDCPAVLCQEFLRGKEYVVDHVSREGVHKVTMIYVYDKRPANGCNFVYFGCVPVDPQSPEAKILVPYTQKVLDALDIKNGPSHGEIMMTADGPCLVEMNCRAHGGDGNWRPLCLALNGGYSQVEVAVDGFLDNRQFLITPDLPPSPFKASGLEVIMVSFSRGIVKSTPGYDEIRSFESFVYLETGVKPGSFVDYTIDLFTGIGSVILIHQDKEILERDLNRIREMERTNEIFEYEDSATVIPRSESASGLDMLVSSADRPELY